MFNIGPQELLLILVLALLVVGPKRLPEIGRSLGKGLRELRKAQDEVKKTIQVNLDEPAPSSGPRRATRPLPVEDDASDTEEPAPETEEPASEPAVSGTDVAAAAALAGTASSEPAATGVGEISRTLGRSLAELRRAREEIQRSFRVDLGAPPHASSNGATGPSPAEPFGGASALPAEQHGDAAPDGTDPAAGSGDVANDEQA